MTPAERRRLVGILGRLSSDHDGERAAAGLLASRMLKSAGTTWEEILAAAVGLPATARTPLRQVDANVELALCLRHPSFLRQWERDFVLSLTGRRTISPKQRTILFNIASGLREQGKV